MALPSDTIFLDASGLIDSLPPSCLLLLTHWKFVVPVGPCRADSHCCTQQAFSCPCYIFSPSSNLGGMFASFWTNCLSWLEVKQINATVLLLNSSLAFIKEGTEQQSIRSGFARKALTLQVLSKCLLKIEPKQTDLNSRN